MSPGVLVSGAMVTAVAVPVVLDDGAALAGALIGVDDPLPPHEVTVIASAVPADRTSPVRRD